MKEPKTDPSPTPIETRVSSDGTMPENYEVGVEIATRLRDHTNYTLGVLLTAVEAALGDSVQAKGMKQLIRREMFALMDRNQQDMYTKLGVQENCHNYPTEVHIEVAA